MWRVALWLTMIAIAAPAAAQERAAAEALFQQGRKLAKAGKHAEACEKFAASDKLDPSVGARLQLGRCNREQGKIASAWLAYKDAENLAARNGDSRRAAAARTAAAKLEPRLSYVVLRPGEPTSDLEVRFDGDIKASALLGQPFPVDPGQHSASARAPGHEPWTTTIAVTEPGTVEIEIPALAATEPEPVEPEPVEPKPAEPEPVADPEPTVTPPEPAAPEADDPGRGRRYLAYGVAGGGVALAATGLVFGQLARSAYNGRVEHCQVGNVCSSEGLELIDTAKSRATLATVLTIAGGAAVAAGVVLYITAPDGDDESATALVPTAGPGFAGLSLAGWL